jgi:hypothetical protein
VDRVSPAIRHKDIEIFQMQPTRTIPTASAEIGDQQ